MKKRGMTHQLYHDFIVGAVLLTAALLSLGCNESDPVQFSPGQRPAAVAWISVKTGLADSSKNPGKKGVTDKEYFKILNGAGFYLSWGASQGAAYYEVRASRRLITTNNWDQAYCAAKIAGGGDTIRAVIDRIQPSISGKNCTGCRACVGACPRHAITIYKGKAVIDLDSCIGCSKCYDICTYSAVTDENLTKFYYFAVRAFSQDSVGAEDVRCTDKAYKSRYTIVAYYKPPFDPWCGHCGVGCYILNPSAGGGKSIYVGACPVNAVYYDSNPDMHNIPGMIYIDQSKCIACGLCVEQCSRNSDRWPVRREIISSEVSGF